MESALNFRATFKREISSCLCPDFGPTIGIPSSIIQPYQTSFKPFGCRTKVAIIAIQKDEVELKACRIVIVSSYITKHFGEACGNRLDFQTQFNQDSSNFALNEGSCSHFTGLSSWSSGLT